MLRGATLPSVARALASGPRLPTCAGGSVPPLRSRLKATRSERWWRSMPSGKRRSARVRIFGRPPMRSDPSSVVSAGPCRFPATALALRAKGQPAGNTTIAVVATDAMLTKPQARRLAVAAQDGLARAIRPVHTPLDGDTVFAAATGARALVDPVWSLASLGALAADVLARAVARGVYMAASSTGLADMPPSWKDRFGR